MKRSLQAALSTLFVAFAAAFGSMPEGAQAAYVVVVADPLLGPNYPGQGWSGKGALYIPDNCYNEVLSLGGSGYFHLGLGDNSTAYCNGPGSGVTLTDVQVKLYNGTPDNVFDTLNLAPYLAEDYLEAVGGHNALARLIDIDFFNGQVVGFHTTLSVLTDTNVPLAQDDSTALQLQFSKDYVPILERAAGNLSPAVDPAACSRTIAGNGSILCVTGTRHGDTVVTASTADTVVIGQVLNDGQYLPEPGTLALAGLALGAAGLARRRGRGWARPGAARRD